MEGLPSTYKGKDEEALRDHFLTVLSSHFHSATGETFNRNGKTDIFVREAGEQVLVAECKIWRGKKAFASTIDQILSYLPWRDKRAAVVMFIQNRKLAPILTDVVRMTREHRCFLSVREVVDPAWSNCNFWAETRRGGVLPPGVWHNA